MDIKTDGVTPWCRWYVQYADCDLSCVINKTDGGYRLSWVKGCWHGAQHEVTTWSAVEHACHAYPTINALVQAKHKLSCNLAVGDDHLTVEVFDPCVCVYSHAKGRRAVWAGHAQAFASMDDMRSFNRQVIEGTVAPPLVHAEQFAFVKRLCGLD